MTPAALIARLRARLLYQVAVSGERGRRTWSWPGVQRLLDLPPLLPDGLMELRAAAAAVPKASGTVTVREDGHVEAVFLSTEDPGLTEQVQRVYRHWAEARAAWRSASGLDVPSRAVLTDRRRSAVRARLREGYTAEQLCAAVDGLGRSHYHLGGNSSGTVYDDLELICRSAAQVDRFLAQQGAGSAPDADGASLLRGALRRGHS